MSSSKEETLSPDELRKKLYQTFKNKGVLDTLKTHLRNQLIQELKPFPLTGGEPAPTLVPVNSEALLVSACNSLVADHLRASGYEYTLSVFYPESGLHKDRVFMKEDLLQLLKLGPESALYRSLSNKGNEDKGFLISLLTQLTHHYSHSVCHDAGTQTTSIASYGESVVEKMKTIDKEYENFSYSGDKWFSIESKLAAHRKNIETQVEAEMKTKMQHFKDFEIAKVRMEEKETFHKEFEKLKKDLERNYEMKSKALMDREKHAIDRLQKQQEIEEKNVYMQRQSVLKEIETLRNRENELRMRMEAFEKTCQIQEEKVKNSGELLRRRELAVKTMEETYDQRLKNELSRYQLELKEDFIRRTEKLTENESKNKVETARIQKESAAVDAKVQEHVRACSELKRLQVELDTAQQQISLLTQNNERLRERLDYMSDYPSLKREKTELQGQLRLLTKQLEEAQEENRLLHADLGKPSKEQLALQMEFSRLRSARQLDVEEFENQKQVLQAQLQSEVQRCAQLNSQLKECEEKLQWMTNHVEDIKVQLHQTQQALENEVLRVPKPSLVGHLALELSADKLIPPDIYVDRVGYDEVCEAGPLRRHKPDCGASPESHLELVAEAKARIQELQKDAETLEEAYRNYQQRAVRSTIMLPPSNTKNIIPPAQPRVTFYEDHNQPKSTVCPGYRIHSLAEPLSLKGKTPQEDRFVPSTHLPFTPHSSSGRTLQKEIRQEAVVSPAAFPELWRDRRLPHAPHDEAVTSGDFPSELSPPHSPQLKSTARDQCSPPNIQHVFSSSESSPQPEKMHLEDLAESLLEPGHIPELLLDTAVPLSVEAPDGPAAPHPQDLPEDPKDLQDQTGLTQTSDETSREEEDEVQRWERERKERQEQRQRDQEEARERERQERERLEQEMLLQEIEQPEQEEEEYEVKKRVEEQKEEAGDEGKRSKDENPLEKYMKMVLEAREMQPVQVTGGEEAGHTSPEAKSFSAEKEDGIAAYSHKDEDDDSW